MECHHAQQASDILSFLNQQQMEGRNCDVILQCCADQNVPAHRCVLAANSSYFRALFDSGLRDSDVHTLLVPAASFACLRDVVQFMYTGDVTIAWENVEQTLGLSDYLGVAHLVNYCSKFLRQSLSEDTCLKIKTLVSTYNLTNVDDEVTSYVTSRWSRLIPRDDITELPGEILKDLLRADGCTGFAREVDVLDAVCRWARHHVDVENTETTSNKPEPAEDLTLSAFNLLEYVEFQYLSKKVLRTKVVQCPDVVRWLSVRRPDVLKVVEDTLATIPGAVRDVCDVVFVRSRISTAGEQVRILVYVIEADEWRVWNATGAPDAEAASLHGLESMIVYLGWMYFLCSTTEDMHGYLHKAREWKRFHRVNLITGAWETLTSPPTVQGQSRIVSTVDCLLVIDRSGVIDEYQVEENRWTRTLCTAGFPATSACGTLCIIPMPIDKCMYLLRTVSSGHSFDYAEKSFILYHCDTREET